MKTRILLAVFAIGLGTELLAAESPEYSRVSIVGPGGVTTKVDPSEYLTLVIEGTSISHDSASIPIGDAITYVNNLLKTKNVSYIGVYAREGTRYGDVVKALDTLRRTSAKNIGLSMNELALGREI